MQFSLTSSVPASSAHAGGPALPDADWHDADWHDALSRAVRDPDELIDLLGLPEEVR